MRICSTLFRVSLFQEENFHFDRIFKISGAENTNIYHFKNLEIDGLYLTKIFKTRTGEW